MHSSEKSEKTLDTISVKISDVQLNIERRNSQYNREIHTAMQPLLEDIKRHEEKCVLLERTIKKETKAELRREFYVLMIVAAGLISIIYNNLNEKIDSTFAKPFTYERQNSK